MTRRRAVTAGLLLVAALAPYAPIIWNEALPNAPHSDVMFAVQSARGFVEGLSEGQLYPRWIEAANRGHGAPTFLYYSPGAYYAVAAASLITPDVLSAVRLTGVALALASGVTFLVAARRWSSNYAATALAAALYVAMPYHVIDWYERLALAEFAAFVLYPIVFAAADRLLDGPSRRAWLTLALSYAALVSTHLVSGFMVAFVLGPYLVLRGGLERRLPRCLPIAAAAAAGLACSAAYLVPVLLERDAVQVEHFSQMGRFDWRRSLLFRDEVEHGYQPASLKPVAEAASSSQALVALGAVATLALRRRRVRSAPGPAQSGDGHTNVAWIALAAWTLALQTAVSWPLWSAIPGLATVQFPWRFAGFQALASCVLVARALSSGLPTGYKLPCLLGTLPALAVAVGVASDARFDFDHEVARRPKVRTRPAFAFVPSGVPNRLALASEPARSMPRAQLVSEGEVDIRSWQPHERRVAYSSEGANRLRLGTFAFPGWQARIDGAPAAIRAAGRWGSIEVDVPPGRHEVALRFAATPIRRAGAVLSTLSLLALAALAVRGGRSNSARRATGAAALLLLLVGAGCDRPAAPTAKNLVVVTLDTVRRDHLSVYGYERPTTPNLDAFAERSVVFLDAIAQDTNTNPSHASMFTGLYPHVHGNRANGDILGEGATTLAEILRDEGFATAGFVGSAVLRAEGSGLDRGFRVYGDRFAMRRRSGDATVDRALAWLAQRPANRRFLLFVHFYDVHGPYRPPPEHAASFRSPQPHGPLPMVPRHMKSFDDEGRLLRHLSQFVDRYDAAIHFVDEQFGRLASAIDLDDTAVIVLADHGETLGERYHGLDHGGQVFDEQVRIPFLMHSPGVPPGRVGGLVETVDLLPTALDLLGLEPPEASPLQGTSLLALSSGGSAGSDLAFSSARATLGRHDDRGYELDRTRRIQSIRSQRWKLVRYPGIESDYFELYDLTRDPGERRNLADDEPTHLAEYRAGLEAWEDTQSIAQPTRQSDPALKEQLRALGYVDEADPPDTE